MKRILGIILSAFAVAGTIVYAQSKGPGFTETSGTPSGWYQNSFALVVGIDRYSNGWGRLDSAVNDARAVAALLKQQGFTVHELYDQQATRYAITNYLSTVLPGQVKAGDRFVFYYSGHGQTEITAKGAQLGYLVPVDGRAVGGDDFASYISMVDLKSIFSRKYAAKHVLAVFDSCFSGLMLARSGVMAGSVDSALGKTGVNVLTAGGQGEQAVDGLFARKLLDGLRGNADSNNDSYITFSELGVYVQQQVPAENPKQAPAMGWLDGEGQMIFRCGEVGPGGGDEPTPPPPPSPAPEGMVFIQGGTFMMGCSFGDTLCDTDEKPIHQVMMESFWMDVNEVTQSQYWSVMGVNPSHHLGCADCPVEQVGWNDARRFCTTVGKRLPTEAEWEYAARGGLSVARYGDLDKIAWYEKNSGGKTHPVGQKLPNAFGLFDMFGNVREWCADWYDKDYYQHSPTYNPTGPAVGQLKVLRGSGFHSASPSWVEANRALRASARDYGPSPWKREDEGGFRCVRD